MKDKSLINEKTRPMKDKTVSVSQNTLKNSVSAQVRGKMVRRLKACYSSLSHKAKFTKNPKIGRLTFCTCGHNGNILVATQ